MSRPGNGEVMRTISLEYHDVIEGGDFDASGFRGPAASSYKLTRKAFAEHMDAIADCPGFGASVHSLSDGIPLSPPILLTFDDGGQCAAGPIPEVLCEHKAVAHVFMTTGRIGAPGFCRGDDLRLLASTGHVIGSHSVTHPTRMAALSDAALLEEWSASVRALEDVLGRAVDTASVPGGYFATKVARAAAAAGIRWLFTSEPLTRVAWVGDCAVIGRFTLRRQSTSRDVASLVRGSGVARSRQWLQWNAKKAAKAIAGPAYLAVRQRLFGG